MILPPLDNRLISAATAKRTFAEEGIGDIPFFQLTNTIEINAASKPITSRMEST
jgi:hypothetical protein